MDRELEELIKAYDAVLDARNRADHQRFLAIYEARIDDVIARRSVERNNLYRAIRTAHLKWLAAQRKPATMPPKA